jgi:hypothetical protein
MSITHHLLRPLFIAGLELVCYLTMLLVSKLYSANKIIINEYGAAGGTRTDLGKRISVNFPNEVDGIRPPLWSTGQSSWLQFQ